MYFPLKLKLDQTLPITIKLIAAQNWPSSCGMIEASTNKGNLRNKLSLLISPTNAESLNRARSQHCDRDRVWMEEHRLADQRAASQQSHIDKTQGGPVITQPPPSCSKHPTGNWLACGLVHIIGLLQETSFVSSVCRLHLNNTVSVSWEKQEIHVSCVLKLNPPFWDCKL